MHRQKTTSIDCARNKSKRISELNVGAKGAISPGQRSQQIGRAAQHAQHRDLSVTASRPRKGSALASTKTELRRIASAAIMRDHRNPVI